jgi:transcriptional regulator with XRE-family HTH domain
MTQKELAEIVGTSQPAIARLESGKYNNISLSFLRKIGKALDVEPEIHFKRAE